MTSLKTSIKTITYLSDIGCLEIQGASLIVYLAQQPATPEQLTEILQETPCAAEAFQETLNYQSEPLTLGKANKIASECRKRNEMAEVKRVRENERNKIREKQIQALNDAHSVKER
ncbi:hypothetical protein MYL32_26820 [Escherichia coli]|uniref:hypothetical protein n=1 Tax=Escherichia coli TaxID=562 RepID=UPI0023B21115|nr:hypothetical protein [Escherichia coli]MDF0404221.1 hypothetical protein [Escherichia coli]